MVLPLLIVFVFFAGFGAGILATAEMQRRGYLPKFFKDAGDLLDLAGDIMEEIRMASDVRLPPLTQRRIRQAVEEVLLSRSEMTVI